MKDGLQQFPAESHDALVADHDFPRGYENESIQLEPSVATEFTDGRQQVSICLIGVSCDLVSMLLNHSATGLFSIMSSLTDHHLALLIQSQARANNTARPSLTAHSQTIL